MPGVSFRSISLKENVRKCNSAIWETDAKRKMPCFDKFWQSFIWETPGSEEELEKKFEIQQAIIFKLRMCILLFLREILSNLDNL